MWHVFTSLFYCHCSTFYSTTLSEANQAMVVNSWYFGSWNIKTKHRDTSALSADWPSAQDLDPASQPISTHSMREANGSWGLPVDTESWHISFLNLLKPLEFPSASPRKNSTYHGLISGIAGGSQDHLPLGQWIPIQSTQKGFQRKRLHVNASKFNSLNNVLKPKKEMLQDIFEHFKPSKNPTSNFPRQPAHQASIIGAQFHFTRHSTEQGIEKTGWRLIFTMNHCYWCCSLYQLGNYNCNYKPPNVDHPSAMISH